MIEENLTSAWLTWRRELHRVSRERYVGSTPLTFSGTPTIAGTGSAQFTVLPYSGTTCTCLNGNAVAQNAPRTISVQFTSTGAGVTYSDTLSISDNGSSRPQAEKITAKD